MNIETVIVGFLNTNCYILSKNNHVLVIDPGDEYDKISNVINGRTIDGIIVTHNHFDHIGCLECFDKNMIYDFNNLKEGITKIGEFEFEIIYTPGHKEDSISIYFDEYKSLFVGDFIFKNSIGRTDLKGGNFNQMIESIAKTKRFNDDVIIYPGHGEKTNFHHERLYNPYF